MSVVRQRLKNSLRILTKKEFILNQKNREICFISITWDRALKTWPKGLTPNLYTAFSCLIGRSKDASEGEQKESPGWRILVLEVAREMIFRRESKMLAELNVVFWFVGAYSVVVLASLYTTVSVRSQKNQNK
jgi:hypothetical protein